MTNNKTQNEFFTFATFGTLTGCVGVTWVITGVLGGVFGIQSKIFELVVSIIIAYLGLFITNTERKPIQYVITFLNGFLIYVTAVGGTSYLANVNKTTASAVLNKKVNIGTALTTPWNPDPNLVNATKDLIEINQEQTRALSEVKVQIKTTQDSIRSITVAPLQRNRLLGQVAVSESVIRNTNATVAPRIESLRRARIIP